MHRTLVLALLAAIAILALVVWRGPAEPAMAAAELPVPAAWLPPAPGPAMPAGPAAPATVKWYDGAIQYSSVTNCASIIFGSPYTEKNVGTFVGFAADPVAGTPSPNNVYWLHVYFAGLGNPCSGTRVYLDFKLPSSTALAINHQAGYDLRCFSQPPKGAWSEFTNTADCNQSPSNSFNPYNPGAYQILSTDSVHGNTWPLPQGGAYEFQIPVKSTTVLSSDNFQANLWTLDGETSPWLRPQVGVYVFAAGGGGNPYFVFDNPSYITLTSTYAYNYGYLYFSGVSTSGNSYGELYDATGTTLLTTDWAPIPSSTYGYMIWEDWTPYVLTPNTTYKWRYRFERTGGGTFYSMFQTFTTLPDKQVTIGSGTPAACTDAAIGNALAGGAKRILFDCGPLPITITVSTVRFINGDVTIDGGNKVILSGGNAVPHFTVTNNHTLTLTHVALVNGYSNFACGSVVVQGSAKLVADEARFINNHTTGWGGALCIQPFGSAWIDRSQFAGNSAGSIGGGAIFNDGSLSIYWSDISGNTAAGNGGGIYNEGSALMNFSAVIGNAATHPISSTAGGGMYNTVNPYDSNTGYFDTAASTIAGNWAKYGGGVSNNGNSMSFTAVTIAGNAADPGGFGGARFLVGGGIESYGSAYLVNTLLSGNWPGNCSALSAFARNFVSYGHNLDSAARCGLNGTGDLINTDPRLGPLQLNGGRTRTYGFIGNSPAIDAGDNGNCGFTDQRGYSGPGGWRQVDGNRDGVAVCDIGAFEFRPGLDLLGRTFLPLIRR